MDKRYTVFISSTYADLKIERDAVIRTIMEAGHIPLGMEAFGAANASQWEIITDTIDNTDYYVLVIGARYGSINEDTGLSFTEMEFDYALSKNIPCLVLSMAEGVSVDPKFVDNPELLSKFKKRAMHNRQSDFWKSGDDLAAKVIKALTAEFRRTPRLGWIRPPQTLSINATEEFAQISKENRELKKILEDMRILDSSARYDKILLAHKIEHEAITVGGYDFFFKIGAKMAGDTLEFHEIRSITAKSFDIASDSQEARNLTSDIIDFFAKIGLMKAEAIGKSPAIFIPLGSGGGSSIGGHVQNVYVLTDDGRKYLSHVTINHLMPHNG